VIFRRTPTLIPGLLIFFFFSSSLLLFFFFSSSSYLQEDAYADPHYDARFDRAWSWQVI